MVRYLSKCILKKCKVAFCMLSVLFLISISGACAWWQADENRQPLSMFDDVPLPVELKIDDKRSMVFETEIGRVGRMLVSGRLDQRQALQFFNRAMVDSGWLKISEFDNGASHILIFSKAPRAAAVIVHNNWLITDVEINVSTKVEADDSDQ